MFGDSVGDDFTVFGYCIKVNFLGMLDELAHYHWMLLADIGCKLEEALKFILVGAYVHGSTREYV